MEPGRAAGTRRSRPGPALQVTPAVQPGVGTGPSSAVQRYIVNVDKETLPNLDAYIYKSIDHAFKKGGAAQKIVEFGAANYRGVNQKENVYFVGHGSRGKVGSRDVADVIQGVTHPTTGLPPGYEGKLKSYSCNTGLAAGPSGPTPVGQMAESVAQSGHPGVWVKGAKGPLMQHGDTKSVVFDPAKVGQASAWQGLHEGTAKTDFEMFKRKNPKATPQELATKASELTKALVESFITEANLPVNQWLLPKDKAFDQDTWLLGGRLDGS